MLAELFWPQEMKKLVSKYRAEGVLNENAVKYFNHNIRAYFIVFFLISLGLIIISEPTLTKIGFIVLIFSPLFVLFDLKNLFYREMGAYCFGKSMLCEVIDSGVAYGGMRHVNVENKVNQERYRIKTARGSQKTNQSLPKKGDIIEVCIDPCGKFSPVLNTPHFRKLFSLIK